MKSIPVTTTYMDQNFLFIVAQTFTALPEISSKKKAIFYSSTVRVLNMNSIIQKTVLLKHSTNQYVYCIKSH